MATAINRRRQRTLCRAVIVSALTIAGGGCEHRVGSQGTHTESRSTSHRASLSPVGSESEAKAVAAQYVKQLLVWSVPATDDLRALPIDARVYDMVAVFDDASQQWAIDGRIETFTAHYRPVVLNWTGIVFKTADGDWFLRGMSIPQKKTSYANGVTPAQGETGTAIEASRDLFARVRAHGGNERSTREQQRDSMAQWLRAEAEAYTDLSDARRDKDRGKEQRLLRELEVIRQHTLQGR